MTRYMRGTLNLTGFFLSIKIMRAKKHSTKWQHTAYF